MDHIVVTITKYPSNKEITVMTVKGSMDTSTSREFEEKFLSVLAEKNYKLVIDLKEVDYISSAGWGIFISEIKRIRGQKGDVLLAGMSPEVFEVFELLEFGSFLRFFPDVKMAIKHGFSKISPFSPNENREELHSRKKK